MSVQIPAKIESQIDTFSLRTGEPKDKLLTYLEDAMIAAERLKNVGKRTSLDEIGRKYAWSIEMSEAADRDFTKLDKTISGESSPLSPHTE